MMTALSTPSLPAAASQLVAATPALQAEPAVPTLPLAPAAVDVTPEADASAPGPTTPAVRARPARRSDIVAQAHAATPLGPVTLAATARGLAGLWFDAQRHHPGPIDAPLLPGHPVLAAAIEALERYFAGDAGAFEALPLDPRGTPFQEAVWLALRGVPSGTTTSYAALARSVARPAAVRAVGAAVGRNPLSVIVPCHRVIGTDGTLTGYAGGLPRKSALLALERQAAETAA